MATPHKLFILTGVALLYLAACSSQTPACQGPCDEGHEGSEQGTADSSQETDSNSDTNSANENTPSDDCQECNPESTDDSQSCGSECPDSGSVATCRDACTVAADCDRYDGQFVLYDADHFECSSGVCAWLGCVSDSDCTATLPGYVCREIPFAGFKSCVKACASSNDCSIEGGGSLHDSDNYLCQNAGCQFAGCNTRSECEDSQGAGFECVDPFGIGQSNCYKGCTTAADCGFAVSGPAYDSDNFTCTNGLCLYSGCHNDEECSGTTEGMICFEG